MRCADELVEVAHHLAVGGEVLGAHRPDGVRHAGHVLVEHLAPEPADEVVVALARLGFEEVVVAQAAEPLADVGGQAVELVQPPGRDVAQHLAQVRVRAAVGGRLGEASLHARALLGDDLVEFPADVAEDVAQPVPFEGLLAPPLEPIHQVAEAGEVRARRVARSPAPIHQAAQGLRQVALGHDVLGQGVHDLVGVEVGEVLAAVPARVPGATGERRRSRSRRGRPAPDRRPRGRADRASRPSWRRRHRW